MNIVSQTVAKEWGCEHTVINTEHYCHKRLIVDPGKMSSMHCHRVKHETFVVNAGHGLIQLLNKGEIGPLRTLYLRPGDVIEIPPNTWHRVLNASGTSLVIYEYSTHHNDDDVDRMSLSGDIPTSDSHADL